MVPTCRNAAPNTRVASAPGVRGRLPRGLGFLTLSDPRTRLHYRSPPHNPPEERTGTDGMVEDLAALVAVGPLSGRRNPGRTPALCRNRIAVLLLPPELVPRRSVSFQLFHFGADGIGKEIRIAPANPGLKAPFANGAAQAPKPPPKHGLHPPSRSPSYTPPIALPAGESLSRQPGSPLHAVRQARGQGGVPRSRDPTTRQTAGPKIPNRLRSREPDRPGNCPGLRCAATGLSFASLREYLAIGHRWRRHLRQRPREILYSAEGVLRRVVLSRVRVSTDTRLLPVPRPVNSSPRIMWPHDATVFG